MAIDRRKKMLKKLRLVRYDSFERVCEQLGIIYTFPPEYYRRVTRRWLAKKALCLKVAPTKTTQITTNVHIVPSLYDEVFNGMKRKTRGRQRHTDTDHHCFFYSHRALRESFFCLFGFF